MRVERFLSPGQYQAPIDDVAKFFIEFSMIGIMGFIILVPAFSFLSQPTSIGVTDGKLAPCPKSPNCVSSQTDQTEKRMEPLQFTDSAERAMQRLREMMELMPRTRIVTQTENYLHVEVRSLLMRYVDDVEFSLDSAQNQIHFRSASRAGYSDLGVNRKRMEKVTQLF